MPLTCSFLALHSFPSHLKSFPWNPLVELHVDLPWSTLSLHISFVPPTTFFFFFWLFCPAYRILVPPSGHKPVPPAVEAQCLNHWITRQVFFIFNWMVSSSSPLPCSSASSFPSPSLLTFLPGFNPTLISSSWAGLGSVLLLPWATSVLFQFFTRNPRACCFCQLLAFLSSFTPSLILSIYSASCYFTVTTLLTVKKTPFRKIQ